MSRRDPDLMDLIGPYVLGACTPAEAADVRARMVVDAEFRLEVESYAAVREALLEAPAPEVNPDTEMRKAQIMGLVREEASLFAAAAPIEVTTAEKAGAPLRGRVAAALASLRQPRWLAVLATVLVAVIVGGIAVGIGGSSDDRDPTVRVTAQVLGDAAPKGQAEMVVDGDSGQIRVSGFPSPGQGRKYQVWVVPTGEETPKATSVLFDVDRNGNGTAEIPAQTMKGVGQVMLTAEPDGGSPAPTSDPVLQVTMPA